jgi:hypothetical protein
MVKILGPLHADTVTGDAGNITHRRYRGMQIASKHKMPTVPRRKSPRINNPMSIPNCIAWWNLGRGIVVTAPPPPIKVLSIRDNSFTQGDFTEFDPVIAPTWHAADLLHNNRPYCTFDGINDRLWTPDPAPEHAQPLEFWIVFEDLQAPNFTRSFFETHNASNYYFRITPDEPQPYRVNFGLSLNIIPSKLTGVHLFRIVINGTNSFAEVDGVPQLPPGNAGTHPLNRLVIGALYSLVSFTKLSLYDFSIFNSILNPVERRLLLTWYLNWFNLP